MQELAHEYTLHTAVRPEDPEGEHLFGSNDPSSPLNPRGDKFNARLWASNFAQFDNERGRSFRRIGLCFQNLSVFGYSTPTDFQKNVGNIWLALPGLVRHVFSSTAGRSRIDIIHHSLSNGLILPSEMLAVLGSPGSGTSTFLKTISGDTNGIYVNKGSYFNYHARP